MILKLLIKLGLRDEKRFLRLLAKLEYGVSLFCSKLSAIAANEGHENLSTLLTTQAREEKHHGRMLASLADGKERVTPLKNAPGSWQDGHFENFDGISKRYVSLRLLFGNRRADDYQWCDRLAFMCVLEEQTSAVYEILSEIGNEQLRAIAQQIKNDEIGHCDCLKYALAQFSHFPEADLQKWEKRLFWAKLGLLVDMWNFIWQQHQTTTRYS
jgi:rubrerythrin